MVEYIRVVRRGHVFNSIQHISLQILDFQTLILRLGTITPWKAVSGKEISTGLKWYLLDLQGAIENLFRKLPL